MWLVWGGVWWLGVLLRNCSTTQNIYLLTLPSPLCSLWSKAYSRLPSYLVPNCSFFSFQVFPKVSSYFILVFSPALKWQPLFPMTLWVSVQCLSVNTVLWFQNLHVWPIDCHVPFLILSSMLQKLPVATSNGTVSTNNIKLHKWSEFWLKIKKIYHLNKLPCRPLMIHFQKKILRHYGFKYSHPLMIKEKKPRKISSLLTFNEVIIA